MNNENNNANDSAAYKPKTYNVFYDAETKDYLMPDESGRWIRVRQGCVERYLSLSGCSSASTKDEPLSETAATLTAIQLFASVWYSSSLAGHNAGCYQMAGKPILVTDSPVLILPAEGSFPLLNEILTGMFEEQLPYVFSWLKLVLAMLYSKKWQPIQILAMAGPPASGKSLFQSLITAMTGGRVGHPYQYITGKTTFNSDYLGCEHLAIEDEAESPDIRSRRHIGANMKMIAANKHHRCHRKHAEAITLTPLWFMTVSLNDEPDRLRVLPPIEGDIADKIMLLKVYKKEMPMPTSSPEEKDVFFTSLEKELPAFVHYLLRGWAVPSAMANPRFGVRAYHHPDLLMALEAIAPEQQMHYMIDEVVFEYGRKRVIWRGWTVDLERVLTNKEAVCEREAKNLFYYSGACGSYLAKLEQKYPDRFMSTVSKGRRKWTILPPPEDEGGVPENASKPRGLSPDTVKRLLEVAKKKAEEMPKNGNGHISEMARLEAAKRVIV